MKSAAGFFEYTHQVQVDYAFIAGFSVLAIVGIYLGSRWAEHISQRALKRGFATFLVVMGVFMLLRESGGSSSCLADKQNPGSSSTRASHSVHGHTDVTQRTDVKASPIGEPCRGPAGLDLEN